MTLFIPANCHIALIIETYPLNQQPFGKYLSNTVDLLVDFSPVMVALLTCSCNREANTGRMPRTDTRHLTQTLVRLARQFLGVPTRRYT